MLYHITKKTASSDPVVLEPVSLSDLSRAGWKEKDLENVLADRIDYLIRGDQLMVIFQERQFQEDAGPRNPRLPRRANSGNCLGAFVLRCTAG